jgi:hypothetical protein
MALKKQPWKQAVRVLVQADPLAVQHVHMTPSLLQYSAKLAVGSMWAAGVHVNASTAANGR